METYFWAFFKFKIKDKTRVHAKSEENFSVFFLAICINLPAEQISTYLPLELIFLNVILAILDTLKQSFQRWYEYQSDVKSSNTYNIIFVIINNFLLLFFVFIITKFILLLTAILKNFNHLSIVIHAVSAPKIQIFSIERGKTTGIYLSDNPKKFFDNTFNFQ